MNRFENIILTPPLRRLIIVRPETAQMVSTEVTLQGYILMATVNFASSIPGAQVLHMYSSSSTALYS